MPNSPIDTRRLLKDLLHRFVKVAREDQGATWRVLKKSVTGKSACMQIDGCVLRVSVPARAPFRLRVTDVSRRTPRDFRADARILRRIITGAVILDKALADGDVFVRGGLEDLLRMHALVMNVLADGATCRKLRLLWHEFDARWPSDRDRDAPAPLHHQGARYGACIDAIPRSILRTGLARRAEIPRRRTI